MEEEYCALGLALLFQSPLREAEQAAGNRALGGITAPTALIPREHPWLATGEGVHRFWGVLEIANSAARSRVLCGRQKDEEGK